MSRALDEVGCAERMRFCRIFVVILVSVFTFSSPGADPTEVREWQAARTTFETRLYQVAAQNFENFLNRYPQSEHRAEALLRVSQCRFYLAVQQQKANPAEADKLLADALERLRRELPLAGEWADRYQFWLGEIEFHRGKFSEAAEAYSVLARDFPASHLALRAAYNEALSWHRLQNYPRTVQLLRDPAGAFQAAVKQFPSDELVAEGALLEAEALLASGQPEESLKVLIVLQRQTLSPQLDWQRRYLLCRALLRQGRPEEALSNVEGLYKAAADTGDAELRAESVFLEAEILEQTGQFEAAIQALEKEMERLSELRRRNAVLKVIQLYIRTGKLEEAASKLAAFLDQFPADGASHLGRLVLGELRLKEFFRLQGTNVVLQGGTLLPEAALRLSEAEKRFEEVIATASSNEVSQAWFGKGWTAWGRGQVVESKAAFQEATRRLGFGEDQAVAHFKLGDLSFLEQDWSSAVTHYEKVVQAYQNLPRLKQLLLDQALYQLLRTSLQLGDEEKARHAMRRILEWYPESYYSEQGILLVGQYLNRVNKPAEARVVFEEITKKSGAILEPEVRLAIARTYVQEKNWNGAVQAYNQWLEKFPQHSAAPQVEFDRAWTSHLAGRKTEAVSHFTSFLERNPKHKLAPLSQLWLADYFFELATLQNNPEHYKEAERGYQAVIQNWPDSSLVFISRLRVGKTAIARYSFKQAEDYLTRLIEDPKCPPSTLAEAYFAYGDLLTLGPEGPEKFKDAIPVFSRIPQNWPETPMAAAALARMGDCFFQLGTSNPQNYTQAESHYTSAFQHAQADLRVRSLAKIGLGHVVAASALLLPTNEQAAKLQAALKHYTDVVFGTGLGPSLPESFYRKEAGLAAIKILEKQEQWEALARFCERLALEIPALQPVCRQKMASIQKYLTSE